MDFSLFWTINRPNVEILCSFLLFFCLFGFSKKETSKPNVIYYLADYLGYGEIGVYGQKIIETPNIEA